MRKTDKVYVSLWVLKLGVLIYIFIPDSWKLVYGYDEGILGIKIDESK